MNTDHLNLSQISLYNTQRVSDEQSRMLFVARTHLFQLIIESIRTTRKDAPPQHHLILGQRGMGKTTLLKRIEVELRSSPLHNSFIPLLFPEEQYNLDSLDTFWLNCLDSLADVLEKEEKLEDVAEIDREVARLSALPAEERTKRIYPFFRHFVFTLQRRPVLLIDNINFVLQRLSREEQHTLRSLMTEDYAPIIIGASSNQVEETNDYRAPFYDAFQVHFLKRLTSQELTDILNNLATVTGQTNLKKDIQEKSSRLKALNQLTGGNPRTAVILFKQAIKGFSDDITGDLDGILDDLTPIYKARFEELPEKMQIIINAIAMQWDPITLEQIRNNTKMDNGQISPQLKRLNDAGWIEKPQTARGKGGSYEVSERMFNIWYLMRRSSRRQKKTVFCLSKFLEAFYEKGEEFLKSISKLIPNQFTNEKHAIAALAIARLVEDKDIRWELHGKARDYIIGQSQTKPSMLDNYENSDLFDGDDEHLQALKTAIDEQDDTRILFYSRLFHNQAPKSIPAAALYARACIKSGDFDVALQVLEAYNSTEISELLIDLAIAIHDKKASYDPQIENLCKKVIRIDPKNNLGYLFLGKYYNENNRCIEAIDIVKDGLQHSPNNAFLLGVQGEAYTILEDYENADKCFSSFDLSEAGVWTHFYHFGIVKFRQEHYQEAEDLFTKGLSLEPNAWVFSPWITITQYMQGKEPDARTGFLASLEKVNDINLYISFLAQVFFANNSAERLINLLQEGIEHRPDDESLKIHLAACYINDERLSDSSELLESILAINPQNAIALHMMGYICWRLGGGVEKAKSYLLNSIQFEENADTYFLLAQIEKAEKEYDSSASHFEKALILNPDDTDTINSLSLLYEYKLGNIDRATNLALKAYEIDPEHNAYRLVNLYRDCLKNPDEANRYYTAIPQEHRSREWDYVHTILTRWIVDGKNSVRSTLCEFVQYTQLNESKSDPEPRLYLFAKCIELGGGNELLQILEETGSKETALPEYHAIAALLSSNSNVYFDTLAHEFRDVGNEIAQSIAFYIKKVS